MHRAGRKAASLAEGSALAETFQGRMFDPLIEGILLRAVEGKLGNAEEECAFIGVYLGLMHIAYGEEAVPEASFLDNQSLEWMVS